jgi:hypothetical protein
MAFALLDRIFAVPQRTSSLTAGLKPAPNI